MFGIGGIFTEALSDVTFRLAPLTETDTSEMLGEIKAKSLLGAFRGEKAANRDELTKTLMGLSRIGMEIPEISEIDINPLVITSGGSVVAVDALIVPGEKQVEKTHASRYPQRYTRFILSKIHCICRRVRGHRKMGAYACRKYDKRRLQG